MAKMTIEVNENGDMQLGKVYSGVVFVTEDKERFGICMRDTGFEFCYAGKWYEAKGGEIRPLASVTTTIEHTEKAACDPRITVSETKVETTKRKGM